MILSGDLKDFSLADVLQLLLQQRKTGTLALGRGKEKAELYVVQGNLGGVKVDGVTPEGRIREILVGIGRLSKGEMSDLEAISRDMGRPLLATLVSKGHLAEEERKEWAQIITEDMVCELFGWLEGRYEFSDTMKPPAVPAAGISTEFACMEGMRRLDEWPRLREELPDSGIVFRPTGKAFEGDAQSWDNAVLALVDSRRTVAQMERMLPFGSFRLAECIVNLWHDGIIAPVEGAGGERKAPVAADPQSEKDRMTALVLGAAVLILAAATAVRLAAIWMDGAAEAGIADGRTDRSADGNPAGNPAGLEAGSGTGSGNGAETGFGVSRALARDNVETFLIDIAARTDSLPPSLDALRDGGILTGREIRAAGIRTYRRPAGGLDFILK